MFEDEKNDRTDSLLNASLFPASKDSDTLRRSSLVTATLASDSEEEEAAQGDYRDQLLIDDDISDEEAEEIDEETGLTKSQKVLGLICVSLMVVIWLIMSLIGGEIKCPIFARYFVCSLYTVLFPIWLGIIWMKKRRCQRIIIESDQHHPSSLNRNGDYTKVLNSHYYDTADMIAECYNPSADLAHATDDGSHDQHHTRDNHHSHRNRTRTVSNAATDALKHTLTASEAALTIKHLSYSEMYKFVKSILPLAVLATWMAIMLGWFWYTSLEHTDFTVNNVIYQSSCAFVYLLACFVTKTATLTVRKTLSVCVCLAGVVIISFNSGGGNNDNGTKTTLMGIIWCVMGVICYAIFIIVVEWIEGNLYRQHLSTEDSIFLTALIGPITLLTFWPVLIIVDISNLIKVEIPYPWISGSNNSIEFWKLLGMGLLDLFYYLFLLLGVSYSNAVLMSTGTLMLIPVSFVLDTLILGKYNPNLMAILGALLICIGFLCMQVSPKLMVNYVCSCCCCNGSGGSDTDTDTSSNNNGRKEGEIRTSHVTTNHHTLTDSPRSPALL